MIMLNKIFSNFYILAWSLKNVTENHIPKKKMINEITPKDTRGKKINLKKTRGIRTNMY